MKKKSEGQVLPLFAIVLVGLIAMMALAIDVTGIYAARRALRSASDAAALAGGQDLQVTGSRQVTAAQYATARNRSRDLVQTQLGGTVACVTSTSGTRLDCTLTVGGAARYEFAVITPITASSCQTCDPARSVQVSIANPAYQTPFSGVPPFNRTSSRIAVTSVAGLQFNHAYTIVTLRPPTGPAIPGVRDISVNGGTKVFVTTGDVATNANMVYSGTGSAMVLDSGYYVYYYDPFNPPLWGSSPQGSEIFNLIPDPGYPVPVKGLSPPSGTTDSTNCASIATAVYSNPDYAPSVPVVAGSPDMTNITCYMPGVYSSVVNVNNGTLAILEPGLYFLDGGLNAQGSVIGGYTPASPGVALVFRENQGTVFKNRTGGGSSSLTQLVALNAGTKYSRLGGQNAGGQEATAARDYNGNPVQTNTTPARLMTVIVPPDANCPVSLPLAASCTNTEENQNKAIDLSGGSALYLAGVQYAPSDNVSIAGNTATGGYVGQVWAWTLVYTGGSTINQEGADAGGPGTLRLDAACTAPGTNCTPSVGLP
jgi:Flp pilus assembly protein TadG